MEIKVQENNSTNYNLDSAKDKKYTESNFSDILNEVATNSTSNKRKVQETDLLQNPRLKAVMDKIDALPKKDRDDVINSIKTINKALGINIFGNADKFLNDDSTINLQRILYEYGDNVSYRDLNELNNAINVLHKNGLVSDDDYFYALKWLETKQMLFETKVNAEEKKKTTGDSMWKSKEH